MGQVLSLQQLAWLLYGDRQFDAAEEAALRMIDLSGEGKRSLVCSCSRLLGNICRFKGEAEKAIQHFETSIGIASSFNWHDQLFPNNYSLAELFFGEKKFDDAHIHIERAKSHAINDPFGLGRTMELQAGFWFGEHKFEKAKSEALRAADVFEGIGATKHLERCKTFLQKIEEETRTSVVASGQRVSMVSSWKRCRFLRLLTLQRLHSQVRAPNTISRVLKRIFPQTIDPTSGLRHDS